MAYVRIKGNQLAIVCGERNVNTGRVEQRVLFTLYSKAEALEALGRTKAKNPVNLESLLRWTYREIKFNWKKIRKDIDANLDALPDLYGGYKTRLHSKLRENIVSLTRQLVTADPQSLVSAAQLIQAHERELRFLLELIQWRLEHCKQEQDKWNTDSPFYWRITTLENSVPPDIEEWIEEIYRRGDYEQAEAIFKLLVDCFDRYAEGYNYLGLIAFAQYKLNQAIAYFRKTVEVGRKLFQKHISKKSYWNDLSTRPYMRGLRNLALSLNEAGRYEEALSICDTLEHECNDRISAESYRSSVYINTGKWNEAFRSAKYLHQIDPLESIVVAFAAFELGHIEEAKAHFLHASLTHSRATRMVVGVRLLKARTHDEKADHNDGVAMIRSLGGFLKTQSRDSKRFFRGLAADPTLVALRNEAEVATKKWHEERTTNDRTAFERMTEMKRPDFAMKHAKSIGLGSPTMH